MAAGSVRTMSGQFTGWPEQAFDVLLKLDGDPPMSVRNEHRADREALVRQPMIALLNAVADADSAYEDFAVWGYGKMVWPWQRQGALVRLTPNVELALRFDLDGLYVKAAWWYAPPEQIQRYRAAVADEVQGQKLAAITRELEQDGFELSGDVMKRVPRGFTADHPRATLLRHRSVIAGMALGCDHWLHTAEPVSRVVDAFAELKPLTSWLSTVTQEG